MGENGWSRLDLPAVLRALRRRADLSQRELAERSGVHAATVARVEAGTADDPKLRTVERLVRGAGAKLAVVDVDGTEPDGIDTDGWRDRAQRRYPAHLDPAPQNRWLRGRAVDMIGFVRNRTRRDEIRRDRAGERRWDLFTEIRRLGPRDVDLLARLLPQDRVDRDRAFRYLRDPSVRHWVAETVYFDRPAEVRGQLVAYVQQGLADRPTIVVTHIDVPPQHRPSLVGPQLAAALCDEAVKLGAGDVVALLADPDTAAYLRGLGFRRRRKRPLLLVLPE